MKTKVWIVVVLTMLLTVGCNTKNNDVTQQKPVRDYSLSLPQIVDEEVLWEDTDYSQDSPQSHDDYIWEIIDNMSLEQKVGQMFIARCPDKNAVQKATQYHLGGYILFKRDFDNKTKEQVAQEIQSYKNASDVPLFIGVDEEGGRVNRVSTNQNIRSSPFMSPQQLYKQGGLELIASDTNEKCQLLLSLGINLNFAPVCDVSQNREDFIYHRTLGKDGAETAEYVKKVVEVMRECGVGSVLKHFPGYGNNVDTHTGIATDNRPYETFLQSDFLPFEAGIKSGGDMVLVSHDIVSCMDSEYPASLSPEVHRILREDLDFSGVIITDDLAMQGVTKFAGDTQAAVVAVLAGNDILCSTYLETQIPAVIQAVNEGVIPKDIIERAVYRILSLKISLGILETE